MLFLQEISSHNLVARIPGFQEGWVHVKNFADHHQTVLEKECREFYSNNPEVFHKEKKAWQRDAWIFGTMGFLSFYAGLPIDLGHFPEDIRIALAHSAAIALGCLFSVLTLFFMGSWLEMKYYGMEKLSKPSKSFLRMFENDKNLRRLWVMPSDKDASRVESLLAWVHPNNELKDESLFTKDYPRLAKERDQINAYEETRAWLKQWSRGDERHLHWVEWKTLYGITQRYSKYLTRARENPTGIRAKG